MMVGYRFLEFVNFIEEYFRLLGCPKRNKKRGG
jgi:hypothetical protein